MHKFNEDHAGQTLESEPIRAIEDDFKATMNFAKELFGNQAFRKTIAGRDVRSPINKSLFESWSVNLHKLNAQERRRLLERKEILLERFRQRLANDDDFLQSVTQGTGSIARVHKRFNTVRQIIREVLDDTQS